MNHQHRTRIGITIAMIILSFMAFPGAALAHGEAGEHVAEFEQHMDQYAADIQNMIAAVDRIVAGYEPGQSAAEALDALIERWESVSFHEAVETRAMPLYPPVWAALGAFSTAIKEGAPADTVSARADDITAALWQGYGALKLLAVRAASEDAHAHQAEQAQAHNAADGAAVIDTITTNLDQVLALYRQDKAEQAQKLIFNTYMNHFEGIEGDLIEQDADLVAALELDFNATLPQLIKNGAPANEVEAQINAMLDKLEQARTLLQQAEKEETSVF